MAEDSSSSASRSSPAPTRPCSAWSPQTPPTRPTHASQTRPAWSEPCSGCSGGCERRDRVSCRGQGRSVRSTPRCRVGRSRREAQARRGSWGRSEDDVGRSVSAGPRRHDTADPPGIGSVPRRRCIRARSPEAPRTKAVEHGHRGEYTDPMSWTGRHARAIGQAAEAGSRVSTSRDRSDGADLSLANARVHGRCRSVERGLENLLEIIHGLPSSRGRAPVSDCRVTRSRKVRGDRITTDPYRGSVKSRLLPVIRTAPPAVAVAR